MSVLLALALAQSAVVPADSEITVMARRLKDWRGNFKLRKGAVTCKTSRSTGDREIDAVGCATMIACYSPLVQEIQAAQAGTGPAKARSERVTAIFNSAVPCLEQEHAKRLAALADQRAGI